MNRFYNITLFPKKIFLDFQPFAFSQLESDRSLFRFSMWSVLAEHLPNLVDLTIWTPNSLNLNLTPLEKITHLNIYIGCSVSWNLNLDKR